MPLRRLLPLFALALFSLGFPSDCRSQTGLTQIDSNTTTGPAPYSSFGGVHENINLATGDLTLQVPLLTLPGRNGLDLSVGLTYDSKLWTTNYMVNPNNPDGWLYWWTPEDRQPTVDGGLTGWRLSIPVLQALDYDLGPSGPWSNQNCMRFFIITMPDGRKAQFTNKAGCTHTSSSTHQITADP